MIIREATADDKVAWNAVAQQSPHATYAHTWEWKETLERGFGTRSLCLVAEHEGQITGTYQGFLWARFSRDGRFVGLKTSLFGGAQVLWSPFCHTWDYGGPCLQPNAPPETQLELLSQMEQKARRRGATDVWVSPFRNAGLQEMLINRGYRPANRYTALIDLTQPEEDLWKHLKGETRSQIRQGQRFGLEAVEVTNREGLEEFYTCLRSVAERTVMKLPSKAFFDVLFEILVPAGMARIYAVRQEGKTLGSAVFLYYKGTLVARYWAAFQETLKLRPYHVLIWHILTKAKEMDYHTCDFGGMPPDEANGIYKFKKGWGVQIEHVDWYIKPVGLGRSIALAKRAISCFSNGNDQRA